MLLTDHEYGPIILCSRAISVADSHAGQRYPDELHHQAPKLRPGSSRYHRFVSISRGEERASGGAGTIGFRAQLWAAAISAVLVLAGWLTGVVDFDLFSPDGAADLETDLYVAAVLVASYGAISLAAKLFAAQRLSRRDRGGPPL
ncbi:hypothetical protein [Mycolicibacterium arseniciresistens]|uniref:Uncharacterized protein n=1 Tax=Mycolicibacterium arseniciresistens TaxID=3062257 RepID=A0ABT8UK56_9MYCO|nr:hypothetical protein [Mycolicibacterium arseniciresistens]MDO3637210.1 hypothetical protein [Mycolicibacterium arseniciresistens]